MATSIVSEKLRRWHGTLDELSELMAATREHIEERIGPGAVTSVRSFHSKVETEYDSWNEFESSMRRDHEYPSQQRIILTIGEFSRNSDLSAEFAISNILSEPGVHVKVRGHDAAAVNWVAQQALNGFRRGSRRLRLPDTAIILMLYVVILVGNYFLFEYLTIPPLPDWLQYILLFVTYLAPYAIVVGFMAMLRWLVPQAEFLPRCGETRWASNRKRAMATVSGLAAVVAFPFFVPVVHLLF